MKKNKIKYLFVIVLAVFCNFFLLPKTQAANDLSITSDTNISLTGPGIVLTLVSGGSLVSLSADVSTLTLNLDVPSNITVKSANLYTLTNSQNLPTLCSGTDYSYVNFTATTTIAVTITPTAVVACAAAGSGSGQGGSVIVPPNVAAFTAAPSNITAGQSAMLAWNVNGASQVNISPGSSTATLANIIGQILVSPTTTTTYVLTARNSYSQSATASVTVNVSNPNQSDAGAANPAYCLVSNNKTYYLILDGVRHGIANPGLLYSYGYSFTDAVPDTLAYQNLIAGGLLTPGDGALIKSPNDKTVFLVADQSLHGFTSEAVFSSLGYKFSSVLVVPLPQLQDLPLGAIISDPLTKHLEGSNINDAGTIYFVYNSVRYPYKSLDVYNSWNIKNDFSRILPANKADLALPVGQPRSARTGCKLN